MTKHIVAHITPSTALSLAMNAERLPADNRVALNVELPGDGSVPEWVHLLPAGVTVTGRDGRSWVNDNPAAVVAEFKARGELVLDWEHATEHRAPKGEDAPAAGWIKDVELRNGELWGRVEWTEKAAGQIQRKEYRFLSPVFLFTRDGHRIVRLSSVGLTNQPNLALTALNQENPQEDSTVWKELLAKLGLPETATEAQAITALNQIQADLDTAKNREATPSLDKYVPRTDYDQVTTRAANAEQALVALKTERQNEAIDTAVNQALEAGKITPTSVEYHKAQCRSEGGLERFEAFVEQAPSITQESDLNGRKPPGGDKALNQETLKIAGMFGNSEEDLKMFGGTQ